MSSKVELWVYDLTNGMARTFGPMILGQEVEGVWHTSVVVQGREWFYGYGIQEASPPGSTPFGQPLRKMDMGSTELSREAIADIANDLGQAKFKPEDYNLLLNNCNHFSDEMCKMVCGKGIPRSILTQHEILLNSPMGAMLTPMLSVMEGHYGAATAGDFNGRQR